MKFAAPSRSLVNSGAEINVMAYVSIFSGLTWSLVLCSAVATSATFFLLRRTASRREQETVP